eukprot:PhM_4_TR1343/c0_g1_i2/m.96656
MRPFWLTYHDDATERRFMAYFHHPQRMLSAKIWLCAAMLAGPIVLVAYDRAADGGVREITFVLIYALSLALVLAALQTRSLVRYWEPLLVMAAAWMCVFLGYFCRLSTTTRGTVPVQCAYTGTIAYIAQIRFHKLLPLPIILVASHVLFS